MSNIFQFLTKKQVNNVESHLPPVSLRDQFLSEKNVSKVTMSIYRNNLSKPNYFNFRDNVAEKMAEWVLYRKDVDGEDDEKVLGGNLESLNSKFAKHFNNADYIPKPKYGFAMRSSESESYNTGGQPELVCDYAPDNIFKQNVEIYERNDYGNLISVSKNPSEMMPQDFQNMDVWKPIEVSMDYDKFSKRNRRMAYIPRHVDRNNEGLNSTPERASIVAPTYKQFGLEGYYRAKGIN